MRRKREYVRDGRAPVPESELVSWIMSRVRGKDTGPELMLRRALRSLGVGGYRLHWRRAPGRPDLAFPRHRLAVFVHGCFWHGCPRCRLPLPKSHTGFWREKIRRNRERDARKLRELWKEGWKAIVVWEHEVRRDPVSCARKVASALPGRAWKPESPLNPTPDQLDFP